MLLGGFWLLTASITSEVKSNYAYVITLDICNKFIEIKFSVRCMVWPSTSPFQPERILKILIRYGQNQNKIEYNHSKRQN